jgi:hypothetical protein
MWGSEVVILAPKRGEWSSSCFAHFTLGKDYLVPIGFGDGWARELVSLVCKRGNSHPPSGIES